MDLEECGM